MFTGLIEAVGTVVRVEQGSGSARLRVQALFAHNDVVLGDSVAINGVCLTVAEFSSSEYLFDVSPETIRCTSLRSLRPGDSVNLERALRVGDRLGGHLVTGHVDCLATIVERREVSGNWFFRFQLPAEQHRYLVEKGSITIDGISLTINALTDTGFTINIIPHTAQKTTLTHRRSGDQVNIETDILAKYVERLFSPNVARSGSGNLAELLAQSGFM